MHSHPHWPRCACWKWYWSIFKRTAPIKRDPEEENPKALETHTVMFCTLLHCYQHEYTYLADISGWTHKQVIGDKVFHASFLFEIFSWHYSTENLTIIVKEIINVTTGIIWQIIIIDKTLMDGHVISAPKILSECHKYGMHTTPLHNAVE